MIKFKSINEFEKMRNQDLVPPIIANAVIGDLLMMKEYIADDYYSTEVRVFNLFGPNTF